MTRFPLMALPFALMALSCADAGAQSETTPSAEPRTMTVQGEGMAYGTPDLAILSFGVTSPAKTAGAAMEANSSAMTAVRDALRKLGVEPRDMQTSNFSLNPVYSQNDNGRINREQIAGYEVNNTLTVRLRTVSLVGKAIDGAVGAGANTLNNLEFGFQEQADLEEEAKRAAVKDARATAELLAEEAGVRLGQVMSINLNSYRPQPQPMAMARMSESADTPIEGGESAISATVSITYSLR